jgi:hypothetical protein
VCVFDEESLDPTVLQAAYHIVRLDAIRTVSTPRFRLTLPEFNITDEIKPLVTTSK